MANNHPRIIIPEQREGAHSDTAVQKIMPDPEAAKAFYKVIANRLTSINNWRKYSGTFTADFQLCDAQGEPVFRNAALHDHFRIDGPGPGSLTGEGYDWVQVIVFEKFESHDEEHTLIRVHPVPNPRNEQKDTAHFFTDESTSTFIAKRSHNTVCVEIHGRNEQPNIAAENLFDKARNAVAGAVAAIFYSKFEWKNLAAGIINYGETENNG